MNEGYVSQLTGRRRKLSDGAMVDICRQFSANVSVAALSKQYGVSVHTIYSVVYWTPRDVPEEKPVALSHEPEFIDRVKEAYTKFIDLGVDFGTNDILMEIGYGTPGEVLRALGKSSR